MGGMGGGFPNQGFPNQGFGTGIDGLAGFSGMPGYLFLSFLFHFIFSNEPTCIRTWQQRVDKNYSLTKKI